MIDKLKRIWYGYRLSLHTSNKMYYEVCLKNSSDKQLKYLKLLGLEQTLKDNGVYTFNSREEFEDFCKRDKEMSINNSNESIRTPFHVP